MLFITEEQIKKTKQNLSSARHADENQPRRTLYGSTIRVVDLQGDGVSCRLVSCAARALNDTLPRDGHMYLEVAIPIRDQIADTEVYLTRTLAARTIFVAETTHDAGSVVCEQHNYDEIVEYVSAHPEEAFWLVNPLAADPSLPVGNSSAERQEAAPLRPIGDALEVLKLALDVADHPGVRLALEYHEVQEVVPRDTTRTTVARLADGRQVKIETLLEQILAPQIAAETTNAVMRAMVSGSTTQRYEPILAAEQTISYEELLHPQNKSSDGVTLRVKWPHPIDEGLVRNLILQHQADGQRQLRQRLTASGGYLIQVAEAFRWCLEQLAESRAVFESFTRRDKVDPVMPHPGEVTMEQPSVNPAAAQRVGSFGRYADKLVGPGEGTFPDDFFRQTQHGLTDDTGGIYEPKPTKGGIIPQEMGHETRAQMMLVMAMFGTDAQKEEVHQYLTHQGKSFWSKEEALEVATHQHYKGGLYRTRGTSIDADTHEETIEYEHLWPHAYGKYNRKKASWDEPLPDGGVRYQPLR